jgi:hypothetical protein
MTAKRTNFKVVVTEHARRQARARFDGYKAARIVDEVHAALLAGRVSARKPHRGTGDETGALYAWTEDGKRIFVLKPGGNCFGVHTVLNTTDEREDN